MARTFLDLCQDMVREVSFSGGTGLETVVGQTGDFAKAVYWVQEADLYVQNLWFDWKFLWAQYPKTLLSAGVQTIPLPSTLAANDDVVAHYNRRSLGLVVGTDTSTQYLHRPCFMEWDEFDDQYLFLTQDASDTPDHFSVSPDNVIHLSAPINTATVSARYAYWKAPVRMTTDSEESAIPDQFRKIIVDRAQIMYAGKEDAPEIEVEAIASYTDMLEKLEAYALPNQHSKRMSQADIGLQEFPEDSM